MKCHYNLLLKHLIILKILKRIFFTLSECVEIFPIEKEHFGISIPTKVVDEQGEDTILNFMMTYDHYDLWSGLWFNEK